MTSTPAPQLWTVARAAVELSLSKQTIYRMVADKTIPFVRLGTAVRFDPAELQQWITSRTVPAAAR